MEPDSKAARLISSLPIRAENYPEAVEQLKLRFGREDLLLQIYVRDLLSLVLKNTTTRKNAPDLAILLRYARNEIKSIGKLRVHKRKIC
ncbi:uncharacterized protein TNCV_858671 [Trichonephila clavipes]|nr:uncharacterized protein TNCV_858671 [Trichonephila clavipes]